MNIAVIPARGGSKRIPRKNVRPFAGRPMIAWSVAAAAASGLFDRILVSTEDPEIAEIARAAGAEAPFVRPTELSDDHIGTLEVISHAAHWALQRGWNIEGLCCIYATAPFVVADDLSAAREKLLDGGWDYVFAAARYGHSVFRAFRRGEDGTMDLLFPEHRLTRTQDLPSVYHDAGQFYWGRVEAWLESRPIFGHRTAFVELPSWRVKDIDTPEDWLIAERLFTVLKTVNEQR